MNPLVRALLDPAAYDHPVAAVELIETHISWIFLTGRFAYKLKKPVNLGFVDFSTPDLRRRCCEEEVRLNRRLAADLYLGLRDLHGPPERAHLGGNGPVIETMVQMRQFQQRDLLPEALHRGAVGPKQIDALADDLAHFHADAAQASPADPWGTPERVLDPALANLETLAQLQRSPPDGEAMACWTRDELTRLQPLLQTRRERGRIRECHGDLHLGNMALHGERIRVFDCLEFSPALRWIDPISDLAFLVMDLQERSHGDLALQLLNRWLDTGGDHGGLPLLPWYLAYRALVRAKVTALRLQQANLAPAAVEALEAELGSYLNRARLAMAPTRSALVITHGISGSGKSHAARQLRGWGWIQLRSDVERLRLHGRWGCGSAEGPAQNDRSPYDPAMTERLYGVVLLQAAEAALAGGLSVVVDATFLKRTQRQVFIDLACRQGAGFGILDCSVPLNLALERLEQRRSQENDVSEANGEVVMAQIAAVEPLDVWEKNWVLGANDSRLRLERGGLPIPGSARP
jgi:aminoglycoside phosphotransferase family enzyme/predicted kinase